MQRNHLSLAYARILFRHLRLTARTGDAFFAGTTLHYDALMALNAEVPFEVQRRLFENALRISAEPELGLSVGRRLHLSSHGPLGVAAFSSPDLGKALECFARYSAMRAQFAALDLSASKQQIILTMKEPIALGEIRCFLHESVMSAIYAAVQFFTGGEADGRLEFAYPAPVYAQKYREFFDLPCSFDRPHTRLCLSASLMHFPSPVADPDLHAQAIAQCENELRALSETTLVRDKVSALISRNPGRLWTSEEMAQELSMSVRTLHRRLKAEHTSFQRLRDEVLIGVAKRYLLDPTMTVELAGHLLGFSDVASFRRSFKRVVGEPPAAFITRKRGE